MSITPGDLRISLQKLAEGPPAKTHAECEVLLKRELELLADRGILNLGPDHTLTGTALEIRVRQLFESVGFTVKVGRPGQEDFVVAPPSTAKPQDPCVLEVKSHRSPAVQRDDLRQLDDWVFDLSGEEQARREGLGGGLDTLAMITHGLATQHHRHPTPHKGVLVFNGPIGTPFNQRTTPCVQPNDVAFLRKRNFCVISLAKLIEDIGCIQSKAVPVDDFWHRLHATSGEF